MCGCCSRSNRYEEKMTTTTIAHLLYTEPLRSCSCPGGRCPRRLSPFSFILFSSSPTLKSIPCGFPTPYRATRYLVCGAGACPVVVTRTALSWSGDKLRVTQVQCYYRVKDIWAEPVGAPFRSVSMTKCPKQRRSSDRYFEDRCYILRL